MGSKDIFDKYGKKLGAIADDSDDIGCFFIILLFFLFVVFMIISAWPIIIWNMIKFPDYETSEYILIFSFPIISVISGILVIKNKKDKYRKKISYFWEVFYITAVLTTVFALLTSDGDAFLMIIFATFSLSVLSALLGLVVGIIVNKEKFFS